jgi:hypothetical protein
LLKLVSMDGPRLIHEVLAINKIINNSFTLQQAFKLLKR